MPLVSVTHRVVVSNSGNERELVSPIFVVVYKLPHCRKIFLAGSSND